MNKSENTFRESLNRWIKQVEKDKITYKLSLQDQYEYIGFWARGYGQGEKESAVNASPVGRPGKKG